MQWSSALNLLLCKKISLYYSFILRLVVHLNQQKVVIDLHDIQALVQKYFQHSKQH